MSIKEYQEANVQRFERELGEIKRPGMDKLIGYIRKSDFYTAPASTHYHLSCEGGLLQHSLNVLDATRSVLTSCTGPDGAPAYSLVIAGMSIGDRIPAGSVTIAALLHDVCKTYFYKTATRNVKNEKTGAWEKKPYYTVDDRMPLGHGPKSAMIVKQFIQLTTPEMYAIWHHMGPTGDAGELPFYQAMVKHPLVWALYAGDVIASRFMEGLEDNAPVFCYRYEYQNGGQATLPDIKPAPAPVPVPAAPEAPMPEEPPRDTEDPGPVFEEAPPIVKG